MGILFVHGVGSQRKGDTIREFGTPLIEWVEAWHRDRGAEGFRVTWADLDPSDSAQPAAAKVVLPDWTDHRGDLHRAQHWTIAEAWWAERLEAPPYSTMLNWLGHRFSSLLRGLRGGTTGAVARLLTARNPGSVATVFVQVVNAIGFSLLYALAETLGLILLTVLVLASLIPIPKFDEFIFARIIRPILVNNLGDFFVCVYDRIQAVNIRLGVYQAINWLTDPAGPDCDRILVAAHSGGTVVILDALGTDDTQAPGERRAKLTAKLKRVRTLVTLGAALNLAWAESARSGGNKVARPIPDHTTMSARWIDFWADFDWATNGGPLARGEARKGQAGSVRVTNGLSPVSDHGGYLANYEEFWSRIAQEADSPSKPGRSRFWPGNDGHRERTRRRRDRVTMLTAWRFGALLFVGAVLWVRAWLGHGPTSDGAAIWSLTANIPIIGSVLTSLATLTIPQTVTASSIGSGIDAVRSAALFVVAVLPVAIVAVASYAAWVRAFFGAWSDRESRASAHVQLGSQRMDMTVRSAGFIAFLLIVMTAMISVPAYGSLFALAAGY